MHLESLILQDRHCDAPNHKRFLDALTTPALRDLTVAGLGPDSFSTIASLLSRSQCSLETLRIIHTRLYQEQYRAVFPSVGVISVWIGDAGDIY
jgi:hypothetical protein